MSALPAGESISLYRAQQGGGPRTVTQLRAALSAASTTDREEFEAQLGDLDLDDPDEYAALVRVWRHRLVMRTRPEILAAVAASTDPAAPRFTSGEILGAGGGPVTAGTSWAVVYSGTGRAGLAAATVDERAAVLAFEGRLAVHLRRAVPGPGRRLLHHAARRRRPDGVDQRPLSGRRGAARGPGRRHRVGPVMPAGNESATQDAIAPAW